ncbi:protein EMSY-LIKE 1-like isoform X2 [Prosopis cineraria]|uniref:protein EMSY-LIKE 1-like isoform X2 n=1 Tax=Prosopis cineraria TaxID=364024 RepID=UPI00240FCF24|nr:protein EMSY-LIKE 1-like isoform X2 [Prosopis cineraria]
MESQIHQLEQEAYSSVLRAFKAQSDALTWEKEGLITELRKELRVSDDEHRELLTRVNADEIIQRIREWRQTGCYQPARRSNSLPVYDFLPSPTVSASHKKQKTSQSGQSFPSLPLVKPMHCPSSGSAGGRRFINRSSSSVLPSNAPAEVATFDPYIGKKVWTRWPEDNHFYEAVITDYNAAEGRHALVYDINTANETWEWVDLKEISPEDIRWEDEDPATTHRGRHSGQCRGVKKFHCRGGNTVAAGRGRGHAGVQSHIRKEFFPPQNGIGDRVLDDIEFPDTDLLVQEVERVIAESDPDPMELERAKEMLKEHEQALVDAIAKLADASDCESDGEHPYLPGQLMDRG